MPLPLTQVGAAHRLYGRDVGQLYGVARTDEGPDGISAEYNKHHLRIEQTASPPEAEAKMN